MAVVLIIDDEAVLARNVARFLERQGHTAVVAHDGVSGIAAARESAPDIALVDFLMPGMDGLDVIRALQRIDPEIRIIMITGHANVSLAIDAMKAGSVDVLTKPVSLADLQVIIDRTLQQRDDRRARDYYHRREADRSSLDALRGDSAPMARLRELVATIAMSEPTDGSSVPPVLVQGETGAGKELVARALHFTGPRSAAPFVEINCAALPAHLLEGELFGHEKGAFTDAQSRRIGLIESADGGTLFLDEIGELDLGLQAKLLRVLENLRVRRLGSVQDRPVDVRIVAATNRDLDAMIAEGRFRSDLLYRLRVFQIRIPPLRERGSDVVLLADHFLQGVAARYGRARPRLDEDARRALQAWSWPGNVRELRNLLERAVLLCRHGLIGVDDLGLPATGTAPGALTPGVATGTSPQGDRGTMPASLEALERQALLAALNGCGWNVTQAARQLSISRDTLRYRIEKFGLNRPSGRS